MQDIFAKFSHKISKALGSPWAFFIAFGIILLWAVSGPLFGFSDTWQLIINTSTTIVTFLMVFVIQNTQNRDNQAMELKLDELIKKSKASNRFIDLEESPEKELKKYQLEFRKIARKKGMLKKS
jgi:low affinity Fe/Cu permease